MYRIHREKLAVLNGFIFTILLTINLFIQRRKRYTSIQLFLN